MKKVNTLVAYWRDTISGLEDAFYQIIESRTVDGGSITMHLCHFKEEPENLFDPNYQKYALRGEKPYKCEDIRCGKTIGLRAAKAPYIGHSVLIRIRAPGLVSIEDLRYITEPTDILYALIEDKYYSKPTHTSSSGNSITVT